jgi:hypothetical protein
MGVKESGIPGAECCGRGVEDSRIQGVEWEKIGDKEPGMLGF